uniref:VWFA domain-containing protein n=1 Tax=Erpetoichthys calabaricus TaxID=27687 RepID=A0A8C4XFZ5_ERPCA
YPQTLSLLPLKQLCLGHIMTLQETISCPVSLQFVIDTSESIALHYLPPGGLVKQGAIDITWEMGGLHFSDRVEHFSSVTSNQKEFIDRLLKIQYIGKGTFTDCALANMTAAMATQASKNTRVRFAVVITDGHVTGSPCGGIKVTAERARDAGIKLFAVAPTTSTYESGLKEIANNPSELFRNNYQADSIVQLQTYILMVIVNN